MIIALLIGILLVLLFITYLLYTWLYQIARNQKVGFEELYKIIDRGK